MLKSSLTLGALMAFVITGSAMAATSGLLANKDTGDVNGNEKFPNGVISDVDYGIYVKGIKEQSITASMSLNTITIDAKQKGLFSEYGGNISLNSTEKLNINVENNSNSYGVHIKGSTRYPHGKVNLDSKDLIIDVTSGNVAYGIAAEENSTVAIDSDNLDIKVNGEYTGKVIEIKSNINNSNTYTTPTNVTINVENTAKFEAEGDAFAIGVNATMKDASASINANSLIISASTDGKQSNSYASGLRTENSGAITVNANSVNIDAINTGKGDAIGVYVKGNTNYDKASSIMVDTNFVEINASANNGNLSSAVYANAEGTAIVGKVDSEVILKAESINGNSYAVFGQDSNKDKNAGGNITVNGKSIQILSEGDNTRGVDASNKSKINVGNVNSMVSVKVTGKKDALGIAAFEHGTTTINGDSLVIEVEASEADGKASGIHAQNNGKGGELATVDVNSANTIIKAKDAISAYSEGIVNVKGNIYTEGTNAVVARGNAQVNINTEGKNNIVQMNGDVVFDVTNDGSSGLDADADINIKLTNSDSYLKGNVVKNLSGSDEGVDMTVTGMKLEISNGGTWNADKDSFVNDLTVKDGGIVEMAGNDQKISVDNLTASDAIIKTSDVNNQMVISQDSKTENVTVNGNGDIADQIAAGTTDAGKLADVVVKEDKDAGTSTTIVNKITTDEGVIGGRFEGVVDENGKVTGSQAKNSSNVGISEMASIGLMAWRAENNDMNKRLGELRDSNGEHGIWTRMTRGESEFKSIKNQYNSYQIGYDEKLSNDKSWTVGAAFTYTDAESSFAQGTGENTHKGFALYGSKLNEDGSYIDLIAKYARLEHEFDAVSGIGKGEYDTNGYSVSAEYGKRFEQGNDVWFEPQVELTYGTVDDVTYKTANAVAYQDKMDSLVGRVGFRIGKDIKQGNVYARASYLYDFDGETKVTMTSGAASDTYEQDLGGGWFEVGIGTNINLSDATYVYLDIERTFGGDVETPWQWNAGVRYSF